MRSVLQCGFTGHDFDVLAITSKKVGFAILNGTSGETVTAKGLEIYNNEVVELYGDSKISFDVAGEIAYFSLNKDGTSYIFGIDVEGADLGDLTMAVKLQGKDGSSVRGVLFINGIVLAAGFHLNYTDMSTGFIMSLDP